MKKYSFPDKFLWGSAFSGPQTEGAFLVDGKAPTIWDHWFKIEKSRFFQGMNVVNDFYHKYGEDIKIAKNLNFNSLRTSIQWARLIPDGKKINPQAVTFYKNVIQEMLNNKIEPIINLHHFDMPLWAQEIGGWENREVVDAYVFFAETCFELFGNNVKTWTTFNEPIVTVEAGYLYQFHYPNKIDMRAAMQVQWNSLIAHIKAVQAFKKLKIKDGKIGIILNITPAISRSNNKLDIQATKIAELFQNRCYLDPVVKNVYPIELFKLAKKYNFMWKMEMEDAALIANVKYKVDFLGINYYAPLRVKALDYTPNRETALLTPHFFFQPYIMPNRRLNPYRGWEIYPKAIYQALKTMQNDYDNIPVYISENGMGVENEAVFIKDGVINDDYRIDFMREHLAWVSKAISEGANCFGYHIWTYIDNWSWCNAYKNRYGVISLDITSGKRTWKASGIFIKETIKNNNVKWDDLD